MIFQLLFPFQDICWREKKMWCDYKYIKKSVLSSRLEGRGGGGFICWLCWFKFFLFLKNICYVSVSVPFSIFCVLRRVQVVSYFSFTYFPFLPHPNQTNPLSMIKSRNTLPPSRGVKRKNTERKDFLRDNIAPFPLFGLKLDAYNVLCIEARPPRGERRKVRLT